VEDLSIGRRIILKWTLKMYNRVVFCWVNVAHYMDKRQAVVCNVTSLRMP
jgi:hypothetical protein